MPNTVPDAVEALHVVAAVLRDPDDRVLLAQRPAHAHVGGLWEFPGGKLEAGEDVRAGLARELYEELGIHARIGRRIRRVLHHYPERSVLLDVYAVDGWTGDPHGREGQPIVWVAATDIHAYPMPAADEPIVRALDLPPVYLITPPGIDDAEAFLDRLRCHIDAGLRLLQWRVFGPDRARTRALAQAALALCEAGGARLLVNADAALAREIGAHGLHLNSRQLYRTDVLMERPALLAASCHSVADLARAEVLGVDLAVLSPVLATPSHPDADPLGWPTFAAMVTQAGMPVYALGGMRRAALPLAQQHGAQGVAGIRGFWGGDGC